MSGNEMAVINSSGISAYDISGIIAKVVFPAALIVALFSLYITPSATQYRYKIEHKLSSEERIENQPEIHFFSERERDIFR